MNSNKKKKKNIHSNTSDTKESKLEAENQNDDLAQKTNTSNDNENRENLEDENTQENNILDLEEQILKLKEEKIRLLAEMENLRKRSEKEKVEAIKFGSINLARDILSPKDNLLRALENVPENRNLNKPVKNLIDGLKMVQKEFTTVLEKHNIKKIEALNKKFDHNFHQAMLEIIDDNKEEGVVIQEIQAGYTMNERLLRPSMVGVSKKTKKDQKAPE